ncbi:LLM class flavin-dependent oxidoreductase [Streptomyces sp. NPDC000878]
MDFSVVAAARADGGPVDEPVQVGVVADRLGYREVWAGEGPTWDAFVLATAIGLATGHVALTAGPVPVSVRDPLTIVRGAASVAAAVGRPVGVALGTSSRRVVEGVHGVPGGAIVPGSVFLRRHRPPGGPLTVAAFGDRAISVAATHADRMVLDAVSPEQVRALRGTLDATSKRAGRVPPPRLAAWLPVAVAPRPESARPGPAECRRLSGRPGLQRHAHRSRVRNGCGPRAFRCPCGRAARRVAAGGRGHGRAGG